jgi:hypothetical protein
MNNLMYQALVPLTGVSVVSILVSKENCATAIWLVPFPSLMHT